MTAAAADAWLNAHAFNIAAAWIFICAFLMFLPGLVVLLGQKDERPAANGEWLASLADDEVVS